MPMSEKRYVMSTGYGRRNLDHDREINKQTNNKFSRELLGNGVVEELADGDIHDEYLMIYCCLTIYDNGDRSD
jgi:hypothetical protein